MSSMVRAMKSSWDSASERNSLKSSGSSVFYDSLMLSSESFLTLGRGFIDQNSIIFELGSAL